MKNVHLPQKPENMSVKLYAARVASCYNRFAELQRLVRLGHMTEQQAENTMQEYQDWQFPKE